MSRGNTQAGSRATLSKSLQGASTVEGTEQDRSRMVLLSKCVLLLQGKPKKMMVRQDGTADKDVCAGPRIQSLEPTWRERTNPQRLSSDLHICTLAYLCPKHAHILAHTLFKRKC